MKKIVCALMALLLCGLCACGSESSDTSSGTSTPSVVPTISPSPTPAPQMAKIAVVKDVDSGLNIRASGSSDGDILGLAESGDKFLLLIEDPQDGWYKIQYGSDIAYISAEYAQVEEVTLEEAAKLREDTSSETSSKDETSSSESSSSEESSETSSSQSEETSRDSEDGEA